MDPATGPTLLGFDIFVIGSILSGVAALAVLFAIYTAVTIKDPMSKRVKALEGRREELKMGLVTASAKKRQSLVRNSDTTDKIKDTLGSMKVLQQSQILTVQQKLAHAGIRNKELAIVVIGLRAVLPILLGGFAFVMLYLVEVYPDWEMKRVAALALAVFVGYKGPEIYLGNLAKKRSDA
ncbi:MAG: tight adherence protein C, partial [Qipengyuania sp.]